MNKNKIVVQVLSHRGLEPSKQNFFSESSYEAFSSHLRRGYGIEFDLNFVSDGMIAYHDSSLGRLTNQKDVRKLSEISISEATSINLGKGYLAPIEKLLNLIGLNVARVNALHFKGIYQNRESVEKLIKLLKNFDKNTLDKLIIFDLKIDIAKLLIKDLPNLHLAPSVADKFDILRFNNKVNNTLMSIDEAIKYRNVFDWVWLDEWDRANSEGNIKSLYNKANFDKLRSHGYKLALVTPELHATSPNLLGNEHHQDAENNRRLFDRIKEILQLKPDLICTDYPEEVSKLLK